MTGFRQSPIDISTANTIRLDAPNVLQVSYGKTGTFSYTQPTATVNSHDDCNGAGYTATSIKVSPDDHHQLQFGNNKYKLVQFHFHTLSEHTVDGKHYDMECHFVHQCGEALLVLGVFMQKGDAQDDSFEQIFAGNAQDDSFEQIFAGNAQNINLQELLPASTSFYTYAGSLTTPPYTENVQWVVLKDPVTISTKTFETYCEQFPKCNARSAAAANGNVVFSSD
jgi:carbonic anhydrase